MHVSGYANRDLIIFTKYNIKNGTSYFLFLRVLTSRISKISYFTISKIIYSIIPYHFITYLTSQTLFVLRLYLNMIFYSCFTIFLSLFLLSNQQPQPSKTHTHRVNPHPINPPLPIKAPSKTR